jgi:hypothetical protein
MCTMLELHLLSTLFRVVPPRLGCYQRDSDRIVSNQTNVLAKDDVGDSFKFLMHYSGLMGE